MTVSKIMCLRVSAELKQRLEQAARNRRLTVSELVRPVIENSISELEGQFRLDLGPGDDLTRAAKRQAAAGHPPASLD